ncbi:hypothetical protein C5Y96_05740 [Blastopirellula marina]|uniref:Uncharacterized protein n=1 Tax=Blastopirellula marina TaxID=124 RepID=A0A2S8G4H6_9BACT|nr:hypothetical protein C5Y96_05740 [Blastopirellula marina]RCS55664.1 hypothetical protein DTL36_05750 [Bremerella cremea]
MAAALIGSTDRRGGQWKGKPSPCQVDGSFFAKRTSTPKGTAANIDTVYMTTRARLLPTDSAPR